MTLAQRIIILVASLSIIATGGVIGGFYKTNAGYLVSALGAVIYITIMFTKRGNNV
jgi:hypothetical protein